MFEEHLHQPIGQRNLGSSLGVVFPWNLFQRMFEKFIDVAGQEFGSRGGVGGLDIHPPAFLLPGNNVPIQSGG